MKPKILFWDIETSPNLAYTWTKYFPNGGSVVGFQKEWDLLSFAYKYQGSDKVVCKTRQDYKDKTDKSLVQELHRILNDADIIVAHNGNSFDIKKANARFLFHKLGPTKVPSAIDTKLVAKRYFSFNSNSLNDLGQFLGLGKKAETGGFQLWLDCMAGKSAAWAKMSKYNKQDVVLLEKVYERMRPYMIDHPSVSLLAGDIKNVGCANCGSHRLQGNGVRATKANLVQRIRCLDCGANSQVPIPKVSKPKK